jgi:hypothetical protein
MVVGHRMIPALMAQVAVAAERLLLVEMALFPAPAVLVEQVRPRLFLVPQLLTRAVAAGH